jgi:nickel-dependent lactate racemase
MEKRRSSLMTTIGVPWAAWHNDCRMELTFPPGWDVVEARMQDAPTVGDEEIRRRLRAPIEIPPLRTLAQGRSNAIVVSDDISRPTPLHRLMPHILAELEAGGIDRSKVCILIGSGSHRPITRPEAAKKLGQDIVETVEVRNHNPYENLISLGTSSRGTPIWVNRTFVEGDLKIAVGSIIPHEMAGFGGGAKVVGVGVVGLDTLEGNHQWLASKGRMGLGLLEGNICRADIEEIALRAGLEMTIDVVLNSSRDIAGVFAGHPVQAHRQGVQVARQVYATRLPESVDIAVFNAYPKDTELLQGFNALNVAYGAGDRLIQPNGTVVVTMAATEGYGHHSQVDRQRWVNAPGMVWNRRLMVFSPNLGQWDLDRFGPAGAIVSGDWSALIKTLEGTYPGQVRAVVFPCGTLQMGGGEYQK